MFDAWTLHNCQFHINILFASHTYLTYTCHKLHISHTHMLQTSCTHMYLTYTCHKLHAHTCISHTNVTNILRKGLVGSSSDNTWSGRIWTTRLSRSFCWFYQYNTHHIPTPHYSQHPHTTPPTTSPQHTTPQHPHTTLLTTSTHHTTHNIPTAHNTTTSPQHTTPQHPHTTQPTTSLHHTTHHSAINLYLLSLLQHC